MADGRSDAVVPFRADPERKAILTAPCETVCGHIWRDHAVAKIARGDLSSKIRCGDKRDETEGGM